MLSLIPCKDFVEGPLLFSKLQATHFAKKKLTPETTHFFKSDWNFFKFFFWFKTKTKFVTDFTIGIFDLNHSLSIKINYLSKMPKKIKLWISTFLCFLPYKPTSYNSEEKKYID